VIDRHTPAIPLNLENQPWQPTLLQLVIRGNPFRGSAGLNQTAQNWLQFLLQTEQLHGLVIYGSPYILEKFLPSLPPDIPYVFTYGQMPAAQAIALNTLFNQA
jgi:beta-glucosidase